MRRLTLMVTAIVTLAGCGGGPSTAGTDAGAPTTADPQSESVTTPSPASTTTTTQPRTSTTVAPVVSVPQEGEVPVVLIGSAVGGETYFEATREGDSWVVTERPAPPTGQVSGVVVSAERVSISTCCEPAAGVRWTGQFGGDLAELGFGRVTDGRGSALVSVDPNGGRVLVEGLGDGDITLASSTSDAGGWWMPLDAALGLDAIATVAITVDDVQPATIAVFRSELDAVEFDAEAPLVTITEDLGTFGSVVVDRASRAWVLVIDRDTGTATKRLLIDLSSGDVTELALDRQAVDQSIDDSGTHLLTTFADGMLGWRRFDAEVESPITGLPLMDRADW